MDRSWKLFLKIIIDFTLILCVAAPFVIFWIIGVPFQRGFFCNDQSLIHPYREDTISLSVLIAIGISVPCITIFIIEFTRGQLNADGDRCKLRLFNWDVPCETQKIYKFFGYFSFGAAVTQTITDITKYSIGRLRPHFISLCNPKMSDGTSCNDVQNLNRYVQDFSCINPSATEKMLRESRLSFPSGHASFGFYTMVFCALYLNTRLDWKGSLLLKHSLQFGLIIFALYTALSRISDYKHHWSDVLAGSILGIGVALITRFGIARNFNSRDTESDQSQNLSFRQDRQVTSF